MRLKTLREKLTPHQLAVLAQIHDHVGFEPGPLITLSYRRELFGAGWPPCMQEAMRSSKIWSVSELELFAAYVSKLNACAY